MFCELLIGRAIVYNQKSASLFQHCWRHWRGPVVCPNISGLCRAGLLCLWLADSRTEKPLDKESGAASVLENKQRTVVNCDSILNIYADVIVHMCELELMLIMNV